MIARLGDSVSFYKIGYQLAFAGGLPLVRQLTAAGKKVFLDLKLHDIGNTVARGVESLARLGATFLGSGSRNDAHSDGRGTAGIETSVNSKPGRDAPKTAINECPAVSSTFRIVAVACDIERPRRSTVTSISTGPGRTCPANTVLTLRSGCSGTASSVSTARSAVAVTRPP